MQAQFSPEFEKLNAKVQENSNQLKQIIKYIRSHHEKDQVEAEKEAKRLLILVLEKAQAEFNGEEYEGEDPGELDTNDTKESRILGEMNKMLEGFIDTIDDSTSDEEDENEDDDEDADMDDDDEEEKDNEDDEEDNDENEDDDMDDDK